MSGKILAIAIVVSALLFGAGVYYFQVYYYYAAVEDDAGQVFLTPLGGGAPEHIAYAGFEGIDATSSPIRYRACFTTPERPQALDERFERYGDGEPRNAPFWFSCFDAEEIGRMIETGEAHVYIAQRNIEFGIDRVVAVAEDGRGYVWEEINECGDKAYDGTPLGEDCPPRE
ncbi:MAG: histidine kinase [Yangia sp.]|nr:histidine kinase [Salipiger sp.]